VEILPIPSGTSTQSADREKEIATAGKRPYEWREPRHFYSCGQGGVQDRFNPGSGLKPLKPGGGRRVENVLSGGGGLF